MRAARRRRRLGAADLRLRRRAARPGGARSASCCSRAPASRSAIGSLSLSRPISPRTWPLERPAAEPLARHVVTAHPAAPALCPNYIARHARPRQRGSAARCGIGLVVMSLLGHRAAGRPRLRVPGPARPLGHQRLWLDHLDAARPAHHAPDHRSRRHAGADALMFTRHGYSGKRFSDVSDNAFYWNFVVAAWLPIYLLSTGLPRW